MKLITIHPSTADEIIKFGVDHDIAMVDLKFTDLFGTWQHTSIPFHRLSKPSLEEGFGFDGSSIRGFQPINDSDMLLIPDVSTSRIDPFMQSPTLSLICDVYDPITRQNYSRDPRFIAKKAEAYLKQTEIGDTCYCGPEAEFFVFDSARFDSKGHESYYYLDSEEGHWNSGTRSSGYTVRPKEGYFPVSPVDTLMDLRTAMVERLHSVGCEVETSHHEVATAGQCEIDMKYDSLVNMADKLMWFKYIVKNTAKQYGKTATFMPKPIFGDNGSGMHVHQSLWFKNVPLFAGDQYAGMSETALYYIGGIIKHAKALAALTNPTTNSYRRLVPGYEAPVNLAYSSRNRSAALRIPMFSSNRKAKRVEVRFPDPSCNGYLAFAAMMMAGVDGIKNKIHPGDPLDKNIYSLSNEEKKDIPSMPGSLSESIEALEKDHQFLLEGNVFTKDVLETWVEYKKENEINPVQLRPNPYEFKLYFDT